MSKHDLTNTVPAPEELEALMARGRQMRSEAFVYGLGVMFHAPAKLLERLTRSRSAQGFGAHKTAA
jgi:hypothetical protein